MITKEAIRQMGHLVKSNGKNFDYAETLRIESLLESVPSNDRGYILLALVAGMGEGSGAKHYRDILNDYFSR
jgi:hypothetical protein